MPEKRRHPRKKRRFLIEIETPDAVSIGFTYDLAPDSIFIRSTRIPRPGSPVTARLSLPDGEKVTLRGKVLRAYRAPAGLSSLLPSGFSLSLTQASEDYARFLAAL
jgi:hypothetical protein